MAVLKQSPMEKGTGEALLAVGCWEYLNTSKRLFQCKELFFIIE